jgi:cell cycle sensor histidine kinase DivJ
VNHVSSLNNRISALVHESARANPIQRLQHEVFIAARLLTSLTAAALLPVYLAIWSVPSLWLMVAYLCLMMPLVSVIVVSWTGRLLLAQSIWLVGLVGLVFTVALGAGETSGSVLAWLVLAPLESLVTLHLGLLIASGALAGVAAVVIALAESTGMVPDRSQPLAIASTIFVAPVIAYAVGLVWYVVRVTDLRGHIERVGAARYLTLSEVIGDLVLRHDRSGAVLFASRESETLFGLSAREIMGRGFFERIHVADRPIFLKSLSEAAESGQTVSASLRLRTSQVRSKIGDFEEPVFNWVELRARRIEHNPLDRDDATIVSIVRDITSHKIHEHEIESARLEAERSAAWKDRFLANVSHELRTPLNAIIGFSEMLANIDLAPSDPAKCREYAEIINGSGQHLLSVVNSILDMSKIEAGRFDILPEAFEVTPLVDACCDMMSLKAEQGGIELVRVLADDQLEIVADKRACKQILINLLSNAVKFTPKGGKVVVGIRPEGNSLAFYVSDTGIGIHAPDLPKLGDAFFQARNSYDRPFEGTGLGLSVVRGLVGLHGGSISIESAQGDGTCVTVRLPLDCRAAPQPFVGSARIETIARAHRPSLENMSSQAGPVKKIA